MKKMNFNIAKVRDKIRIYEKTGNEIATNFLTPAEVQEVQSILKGFEFTLSGGSDETERRIIIIGTNNADVSKYLVAIRIKSFKNALNHRSVLGSILGLGIKREVVGDIIVKENQSDVIVVREMKDYILNNLKKIGNENVNISEIELNDVMKYEIKNDAKIFTIASLRVDALISIAFGVSRERSVLLFSQEKVLINFLPCTNNSKHIKEGDLISVRGYGRIKVLEIIRRNEKRKNAYKDCYLTKAIFFDTIT